MIHVIGGLIVFLLAIPLTIWQAFVFSVLWGWFVVPYFDAPPLSLPLAVGLALVVSVLSGKYRVIKDGEAIKTFVGILTFAAIHPAVALGVGWVATWFL